MRLPPPICDACGYDIGSRSIDRCPECARRARTPRQATRRRLHLARTARRTIALNAKITLGFLAIIALEHVLTEPGAIVGAAVITGVLWTTSLVAFHLWLRRLGPEGLARRVIWLSWLRLHAIALVPWLVPVAATALANVMVRNGPRSTGLTDALLNWTNLLILPVVSVPIARSSLRFHWRRAMQGLALPRYDTATRDLALLLAIAAACFAIYFNVRWHLR